MKRLWLLLALVLGACQPNSTYPVQYEPDNGLAQVGPAAVDMARPDMTQVPDMVPMVANTVPVTCVNGLAEHVRFNNFWAPPGWTLGKGFRWEYWANRFQSGGYWIADGYGGGHAILDGGLNGNVMFDQGKPTETIISYGAVEGPPPDIYSVIDVRLQHDSYNTYRIVQRQNGIPVSQAFVPAGLQRTTAGAGAGMLDVGGSDHSNAVGCIAQLRAWDTVDATDIAPTQAYIPQRYFDDFGPSGEPADLLVDFRVPYLGPYPDLSRGYDSNGYFPARVPHVGIPSAGNDYYDGWPIPPSASKDLPTVGVATNAPFGPNYNGKDPLLLKALARGCTKHAVPAGAKLFDSFCRADQTFTHTEVPDLGSAEYSSFGTAPRWRSGYPGGASPMVPTPANYLNDGLQKASVGIYNRSPVPLDGWMTIAWVPGNSGDGAVEGLRRGIESGSDGSMGLAFRVKDEAHFWAAYYYRATDGAGNIVSSELYLFRWNGYGNPDAVAGYDVEYGIHKNFAFMRVETNGSQIIVKLDGEPVITVNDAYNATETGTGMLLQSALARIYDWTAY